ncbi:hypothetical protein DEI81_06425 [Curtobacterium sp. MCBD17_013]|nr:hypothetical protein DEI81_06425 [Curtobacterium sp. MCBD17_013]
MVRALPPSNWGALGRCRASGRHLRSEEYPLHPDGPDPARARSERCIPPGPCSCRRATRPVERTQWTGTPKASCSTRVAASTLPVPATRTHRGTCGRHGVLWSE